MSEQEQRDWRLHAHVPGLGAVEPEPSLIRRHRQSQLLDGAGPSLSERVVITHDGDELYAYAADRASIDAARQAIERALADDSLKASLELTHWDGRCDEWVDPDAPENAPGKELGGAVTTRTLVVGVGREIRGEFEQSLRNWAQELGIRCEIVEHPHLLRTQVAFTVTGHARKLEEFAQGLRAEGNQSIVTERSVMASPL